MNSDPYRTLGVDPGAGEAELRAAYRRLAQRHHPDHNRGSVESARRFEEVQESWAEIRRRRSGTSSGAQAGTRAGSGGSPHAADSDLEDRLRTMEAELRDARSAREAAAAAARRAAAEAAAQAPSNADDPGGPSDGELGYIHSDDTFTKILSDARDGLLGSLDEKPARERAADVLEEVAAMLRGERRPPGDRGP